MNRRDGLGAAALWAAPLLAGCVLRWEPSPENDEYWEPPERRAELPTRPAGRSEAAPTAEGEVGGSRPPTTAESDPGSGERPDESARFPLSEYRDLIVVDPEIVAGPLAANEIEGAPFSFRSQMQWLAAGTREPIEFTLAWLREWETTSEVGPEFIPVTPRPGVRRVLLNPWLAASGYPTPAASSWGVPSDGTGDAWGDDPIGSDADPYGEGASESDSYAEGASEPSDVDAEPALPAWESAPFRLIAIVNRVDLASDACSGDPGELRYVYAAVDPVTSEVLDLTLIVEVPYPTTRPAAEWARAWRDLAALPAGPAYATGLAALAREIALEADPLRARLRTNEVAFADAGEHAWEMRQFDVQVRSNTLELVQVPLEFTPRADADPATLSDYVLEHAGEIEEDGMRLPEDLRAGIAAIDTPDFGWSVLGVSERLRRAFSLQTCNGCHGGDTAALPFRHIGPASSFDEPAQLSRFLYDPLASTDELRRRSEVLGELGATECAPPAASASYTGG